MFDETQALGWAHSHLIYTLDWEPDNPYRGHLFHWDWVAVEWPDSWEEPDRIPKGEFGGYIKHMMGEASGEWETGGQL